MKTFLIGLIAVLMLTIMSGLTEMYYCHYWTTTPPANVESDYIKNSTFCRVNSNLGIAGILILDAFRDVVQEVRP